MDPREWLARLADHIPDTGKHRTHFYGFYASRVRASRREKEGSELPVEAAPTKRRCPPSWARLISKVYQADPLVCKGCAGPLEIVAYITDELSIRRILDHLGLWPAGAGKAAAEAGGGPLAGRRRGARDPGRLSTATFNPDPRPRKGIVSPSTKPARRRGGSDGSCGAHESRHRQSRRLGGRVERGWKLRSPRDGASVAVVADETPYR